MSKQKTIDSTETENEVTEKLVEQSELEGLSSPVETESKPEIEASTKVSVKLAKVTPGVSTKGNKTGKMGVEKFLMLYPQDYYIATLLRFYYPNSFFTKNEWFQRIQEILSMPIY